MGGVRTEMERGVGNCVGGGVGKCEENMGVFKNVGEV